MIEVRRYDGGITVKGHAGYADTGQDIVCAAVSVMVQTLIASIEGLTEVKIQYDISPGRADITHGNLSERAQLLIDSFFVGVQMIADEYPYNVQVI